MDDRMKYKKLTDDIAQAERIYKDAKSAYMILKNIDSYSNYKNKARLYNSFVQKLHEAAAESAEIAALVKANPVAKVEEPNIPEADMIIFYQEIRARKLDRLNAKIKGVDNDKDASKIKAGSEDLRRMNKEINKKENLSMIYFIDESLYTAYKEFDDKLGALNAELESLVSNEKISRDLGKEI